MEVEGERKKEGGKKKYFLFGLGEEMKRGEKGREGPAEKQEKLGEKLKRVGKRGGHATPVVPFWRLKLQLPLLAATTHHHTRGYDDLEPAAVQDNNTLFHLSPVKFPTVSARKLASTLWELHQYKFPFSKMHHNQGFSGGGRPPRIRRLHHHRQNNNHHLIEDKGGFEHSDPSPSSPDLVIYSVPFPFVNFVIHVSF